MTIPSSFIQELLARTDVVEIVGRHVQLKKGGANFMGLCPFHGEKSPSFSVSPTKQFYHCFGCGASGDAIKFLMEHTGANFVEAVQDLAQQIGLEVPDEDVSPQDKARAAAQRQKQATLADVLLQAGDAYRKHLKASPRAVDYLKGRGVSGVVAARFGLGYAPPGWRTLASAFPAYDDPLLAESGLVIVGEETEGVPESERKRYDRFRDRVMFPIRSIKGDCIGYGGRVLGDEKPKYLNSPETPVFSKGRELYGLFEARAALREYGYVLVTEGYMDVVALAQLGFPNAVATLGTACTTEHVQKLFRFTETVVFSFDGDAAGRRAARKALDAALPFASDTRSVKFLFLPAEHDPDSFIRAHGQEAFAQHVTDAVPLSRFLLEAAREGCDLTTAEGRAHMASNARPLWSALPEGALRLQLIGEIAAEVQLDAGGLSTLWAGAAAADAARRPRQAERRAPAPNAATHPDDGGPPVWDGGGESWSPPDFDNSYHAPAHPRSRRAPPMGRPEHAARLLLTHMSALETLSHDDHVMLGELPAPLGPLFVWLERELHEHGPRPWAALREGLRGHESEEAAARIMTGDHAETATEADPKELRMELRGLLDLMLRERIQVQQREAIAAAATDPAALQRWRELEKQRQALDSARLAPS
ncbi:DNA primase [Xylophilus sp. GW821-FHT01B05]